MVSYLFPVCAGVSLRWWLISNVADILLDATEKVVKSLR